MKQKRTMEQIDSEIHALQQKLETVEGTKTEIYTRIVGYYRSVANWNKGKREEYNDRTLFSEPVDMIKNGSRQPEFAVKEIVNAKATANETTDINDSAASYTFFYRQACPNCHPVKEYMQHLSIPGNALDVDTPEGMDKAIQHQVLASPTVIFFDVQGHEVFRVHNAEALEKAFSAAEVGVS